MRQPQLFDTTGPFTGQDPFDQPGLFNQDERFYEDIETVMWSDPDPEPDGEITFPDSHRELAALQVALGVGARSFHGLNCIHATSTVTTFAEACTSLMRPALCKRNCLLDTAPTSLLLRVWQEALRGEL